MGEIEDKVHLSPAGAEIGAELANKALKEVQRIRCE